MAQIEGNVSVTLQTDNEQQKIGFAFDIIQEHSISIQNQITDNWVESNTALQDHIAQSPLTVTVSGLAGELVYEQPKKVLNSVYDAVNLENAEKVVTDKLLAIPALYPPVDNITQLAKNTVQYVESSVKRYKKIFDNFVSDKEKITRLEKIYSSLMVNRTANTLFMVETPFKTYQDMAIQSITLKQGNSNYIADISITFKQIMFANVLLTGKDEKQWAKMTKIQKAIESNNGKANGLVSQAKDFLNNIGATKAGSGIR